MNKAMRGVVVLAVQAALVLTTAGKYLWERQTRPQVWVEAQLFNEQVLEFTAQNPANRYMQVQLLADACSLPPGHADEQPDINAVQVEGKKNDWIPVRQDQVRTVAKDGKLVLVEAEGVHSGYSERLYWDLRIPCSKARLTDFVKFYVPSSTAMPKKLAPGQTVWALVTVPKQGPPRPIELALSDATGFHPLGQK